jgi:hypothetical protein
VLALSEKQCEKRVTESANMRKITELEVVTKSQADRIAEFEAMCADWTREKIKLTDGYQRLSDKHKALAEKTEQDRVNLAEAHSAELAKVHDDLDLEMRSYTEYWQNVHHWLHELHEMIASSFNKVQVQCLPFPTKGTKEEMIDWVVEEVRAVPDNVWQLNDNFAVLGIEGLLNMLNGEGCQELSRLHDCWHFLAIE